MTVVREGITYQEIPCEANQGNQALVSSSEFLTRPTVRGICRPEERSNKINQRF